MQATTGRTEIFTLLKHTSLLSRMAREFSDLPHEFGASPAGYLRAALFPDGINSWLPFSLASHFIDEVKRFFKQPIRFIKEVMSSDAILFGFINPPKYAVDEFSTDVFLSEKKKVKRSPWLRPLLAVSGVVHLGFVGFLIYLWAMQFINQFGDVTVVKKAYRPYDEKLIAVMPIPPKLKAQNLDKTLSLDEIRERDRKRKEAEERRKREEEERRKREEEERAKADQIAKDKAEQEAKEKAEQEAKDKAAKPDEAKKPGAIELNETAIKDIVAKVYALYNTGFLQVDVKNLDLVLTFKIEPDGSVARSSIQVAKSSGNNYVDRQAKELLWILGESHIFGATSKLTSMSIALTLTEKYAKLAIVGFAPSPDQADTMAKGLNFLLFALRQKKGSSAEMTELLSQMKVRSMNNRVEANLILSSDRAGELLKNKFGNNAQPPN
jgi:flagellar biosynthesis GTPase FlhF